MQYRQGDVFVEKVKAIPEDAAPVSGEIVLAHGEVTGHAHQIKSRFARLLESRDGSRYVYEGVS